MSVVQISSGVFNVWNSSNAQCRDEAARYRSEAAERALEGLPISGGYSAWCHMQCLRCIASNNRRLRALCARGFC